MGVVWIIPINHTLVTFIYLSLNFWSDFIEMDCIFTESSVAVQWLFPLSISACKIYNYWPLPTGMRFLGYLKALFTVGWFISLFYAKFVLLFFFIFLYIISGCSNISSGLIFCFLFYFLSFFHISACVNSRSEWLKPHLMKRNIF